MAEKLNMLLEAEKRGLLDDRNRAILAEARRRNLVPPSTGVEPASPPPGGGGPSQPLPPTSLTSEQTGITRGVAAEYGDPTGFRQGISQGQRGLLTTAGLLGGGAVGTGTASPLGTVAGAGLGYAAGSRAADVIDRLMGISAGAPTYAGMARQTAEDVLAGATMEAGGQAVGALAGRIGKGLADTYRGARARLSAAEQAGVSLTPGEITGQGALPLIERTAESTPLGAGPFQKFRLQQGAQVEKARRNILDTLGRTERSLTSVGADVQQSIIGKSAKARDVSSSLYRAVENTVPKGTLIRPSNMQKVATEIEEEMLKLPDASLNQNALKAVRSLKDIQPSDFKTLQAVRSDLGSKIKGQDPAYGTGAAFQGTPLGRNLKRLRQALDDDIAEFSASTGGETKKAFDIANAFYGAQKNRYSDKAIKQLLNRDPEKVVEIVFRPNSMSAINRLKKAAGREAFEDAKGKFVERLLREEDFSKPLTDFRFSKQLSKYDDETLNAIFGKKEIDEIKNLASVIDSAKRAYNISGNPSGTARQAMVFTTAGVAAKNPIGGSLALVTPAITSRIYLSRPARKLFEKAIKSTAGLGEISKAEQAALFIKIESIRRKLEQEGSGE